MLAAMDLRPGMSVLDCTLGMAADALVAAHAVGDGGQVTGLEAMPLVAAVTRWGLAGLSAGEEDSREEVNAAARRITVISAEHLVFLQRTPADSFDVVYFDPMFRRPKKASPGIQALRTHADPSPLELETIQQARRVCRSRVVVKESFGSAEFSRLGLQQFGGGRYSPIQYGILLKEKVL